MSEEMKALKKLFALECKLNEKESEHSRNMDWLKSMYIFEAEQRESLKHQFSLIKDLLIVETQKSASLEARIQLLEAEKASAVQEKLRYKQAYEEVDLMANLLVERAEQEKIRKDEEEDELFLLLESAVQEDHPVTVRVSTPISSHAVKAQRGGIATQIRKRFWKKILPSLSSLIKMMRY